MVITVPYSKTLEGEPFFMYHSGKSDENKSIDVFLLFEISKNKNHTIMEIIMNYETYIIKNCIFRYQRGANSIIPYRLNVKII